MFTLIMGSNAGGFGLVSAPVNDGDILTFRFVLVVHRYVFAHIAL